jgi:hypothetical protein
MPSYALMTATYELTMTDIADVAYELSLVEDRTVDASGALVGCWRIEQPQDKMTP